MYIIPSDDCDDGKCGDCLLSTHNKRKKKNSGIFFFVFAVGHVLSISVIDLEKDANTRQVTAQTKAEHKNQKK